MKNTITPLTDFEEDLLYMAYRYAIGRHTIHSHSLACDILSNWYERIKLNPDKMLFISKDMNNSIEDCMRWGYNIYIDNYNHSKNIFPYELYLNVVRKEIDKGTDIKQFIYKQINIYVDNENQFIDYEIKYPEENEVIPSYSSDIHDLEIWNNVAKILDLSTYHHAKLIDDSIVEYIEFYNNLGSMYRVVVPDYIHNTYRVKLIPDEIISEYID